MILKRPIFLLDSCSQHHGIIINEQLDPILFDDKSFKRHCDFIL